MINSQLLEEENERLRDGNKELKTEKEIEIERLTERINILGREKEIARLTKQVNDLEGEKKILNEQNEFLMKEIARLTKRVNDYLEGENKILNKENEDAKKEIARLTKQINELEEEEKFLNELKMNSKGKWSPIVFGIVIGLVYFFFLWFFDL